MTGATPYAAVASMWREACEAGESSAVGRSDFRQAGDKSGGDNRADARNTLEGCIKFGELCRGFDVSLYFLCQGGETGLEEDKRGGDIFFDEEINRGSKSLFLLCYVSGQGFTTRNQIG